MSVAEERKQMTLFFFLSVNLCQQRILNTQTAYPVQVQCLADIVALF